MKQSTAVLLVVLALVATATQARNAQPVSPGKRAGMGLVSTECPTFLWTEPDDAEQVDLVVYHVSGEGVAEPGPVLSVTLPGSAGGWTPSLESCLEPGGRYAWAVRGGGASDWSEASLFEVASPSVAELQRALRLVSSYLREQGVDPGVDGSAGTEPLGGGTRATEGKEQAGRRRPSAERLRRSRDGRPDDQTPAGAEAPDPSVEGRSINVDSNIELGAAANLFKDGKTLLWTDLAGGLLALGEDAMRSNTTGSQNTAVGTRALYANRKTGQNTAVGYEALRTADYEDGNTAVGAFAISEPKYSYFNTAVGAYALRYAEYVYDGTAVGYRALEHADFASDNTAVGAWALQSPNNGDDNTAVGHLAMRVSHGHRNSVVGLRALTDSTDASDNSAVGFEAMTGTTEGASNSALGAQALHSNSTGSRNSALGAEALFHNRTGSGNIAIGERAGYNLADVFPPTGASSYDDNIFIGNEGELEDEGFIRIGTVGTHSDTFIAGDVAIGTTEIPSNKLLVKDAIISFSPEPSEHVALLENTAADAPGFGNNVLALRVPFSDPTTAVNFVTFFDGAGAVGAIEGDGAGGITLKSGSGDFAEFLPRLDPAEPLVPGDVVGVFGGRVSRRTEGADRVLVVTSRPIVLGNDPGPDRGLHEKVALLGQVPVRVRGEVRAGDLLVASGRQDGTAVGVPADELEVGRSHLVVGRSLEESRGESVPALVGLAEVSTAGALGARREILVHRWLLVGLSVALLALIRSRARVPRIHCS